MKMILLFFGLNLFYVIITTIKSIMTINGSKWAAAGTSAFTHFVYTYVLIFMQIEGITTLEKAFLVAAANFLGVFTVKLIEEKTKKDRLWIYQCTAKENIQRVKNLHDKLKEFGIKSIYTELDKDKMYSLQIYSNTSEESSMIKAILENYHIKYSIIESKGCN